MKKSVTKNYIYNLIYQILVLILPLITTPYISRVLGVENIGIYSYTLSISAYFILFGSLGIAMYGKREIAYQQKKGKKVSKTFWEIVALRFITMSISMILFYIVFILKENYLQVYYKILLLEIFANCLDISWFFQGLEEFKKTVIRNTVVKVLSIIAIFVFVKTREDLPKYFIIYVLSILLGNISLWLYLPKYLPKVKLKQLNLIQHIKPTIALFIPQIAIQVYTILDKTMIGATISDKKEVGYYEQSQQIIKVVLTVVTSLGTVMMPRIASSFAGGNKKSIEVYMKKSFNMVFLLSIPMIFGILSVAKAFVPVFFGGESYKVIDLMMVISPIILLIGTSNVTGTQYLLPTKRQKEFTLSVIFGAMVNFVLNFILIKKLGALGASIGTVIAEATVAGVQIYFTRKDFDWKNIIKMLPNYIISGTIMLIVCLFVRNKISDNKISVITQVIAGSLTYGIILLLMKDEMVYEVMGKIKNKIHIKKVKQ